MSTSQTTTHRRAIIITGAASGIGKAFLSHYSRDSEKYIIAIDRTWPDGFAAQYPHAVLHTANLTDSEHLSDILPRLMVPGADLSLVIHSAGIRGLNLATPIREPGDVAARETYDAINGRLLLDTLNVNCVGTYNLLRLLIPALERTAATGRTPKVIVMGSRMGSLTRNTPSVSGASAGGGYAYRASKAALNAMVRSFAVDVPRVLWMVVHPGRVESGLVPVREQGAITAEESVQDMLAMIERATFADDDAAENGRFVDRWGNTIPW